MKLIKFIILMILLLQLYGCGQKGVLYKDNQPIETENNNKTSKSQPDEVENKP